MRIYNQGVLVRDRKGKFSSVRAFIRKVWFWTKVSASVAFVGSVIFVAGAISASTSSVSATTTVIDHTPEKVQALKAKVVQEVSDCERAGKTEDDAPVTFDPDRSGKARNVPSFGVMQFKVPTVVQYVKKFDGRQLTDKEAILLALDEDQAKALATHIIFDEQGGIWNWANCANTYHIDQEVTVIKKLIQ